MDFDRLLNTLHAMPADPSIRGDGQGRFAFAKTRDRAVEISDYEKGVWVEYWVGDDDTPKFDRTFPNAHAATADAARWLADSVPENPNASTTRPR